MQVETKLKIRENYYLYRYLREDSSWYKYLNRDPLIIKNMEAVAKKYYKLRGVDKLENVIDTINLVETFLEVLK